jgi:hypothetical protein
MQNRFQDQNLLLKDFQEEVAVVCAKCQKKAKATVYFEEKKAKLICSHCGFYESKSTQLTYLGSTGYFQTSANSYFDVELWYAASFKSDFFLLITRLICCI